MELQELAELISRPAVRAFDLTRPIPPNTVERLIETARWTGSARNRQPWTFVEVRDRPTIRKLSELGAYAQFLATAPIVLAIASAEDGFSDTPYDAGRITQTIVLAAAQLGLSSCPATVFPDANVDSARKLLRLDAGWCPGHLLALGYPSSAASFVGTPAIQRGRRSTVDILSTIR